MLHRVTVSSDFGFLAFSIIGCKMQHFKPLLKDVSLSENISLFALYSKNLLYPTFFCGCPYEKKIVLPPLTELLGQPVQNIFFPLINKSYKPYTFFFYISLNFVCFGTPLDPLQTK